MRLLLLLSFFCILFIACDNSTIDNIESGPTKVMFYNSSTDTLHQVLFLDDFIINVKTLKYNQNTNYVELPFNNGQLTLKDSITSKILYSLPILLRTNMNYSIFLTGKNSKNNYQYVSTEDSLNVPTKGRAKYRFLNLFDFGYSVDFYLSNTPLPSKDSLIYSNVFYRGIRDFKELKAGIYNIKIKSLHPKLKDSIITNHNFENGKIYTLLINEKLSKDSIKKMQLNIITNK